MRQHLVDKEKDLQAQVDKAESENATDEEKAEADECGMNECSGRVCILHTNRHFETSFPPEPFHFASNLDMVWSVSRFFVMYILVVLV